MTWQIVIFEIKQHLKRISTWVYFIVLASLCALAVMASGNVFPGATVSFGAGGKVFINSSYSLHCLISFISYLGLMIIAPVMGQAVYRDFRYNFHPLVFTTRITKTKLLFTRFLAAYVVLFLIFCSIGLGAMVASLLPIYDKSIIGPNQALYFIFPYLTIILPNIFVIGSIFFALASVCRKMMPVYVGSVVLLMGWILGQQLIKDIDNKLIVSLIEPFGINATMILTEYWSIAEKNVRIITFAGNLLYNRLLWMAMGMTFLGGAFYFFDFRAKDQTKADKTLEPKVPSGSLLQPIAAGFEQISSKSFTLRTNIQWLFRESFLHFKFIAKNVYFLVIVFCGGLFLVVSSTQLSSIWGTPTYPITSHLVELLGDSFYLFVMIVITFMTGELVWRERDLNFNQVYDALPVSDWVFFWSKILALFYMVLTLLAFVLIFCLGVQIINGYFRFEILVYCKYLLGIYLVSYVQLIFFTMFLHVMVNNKYLGHFIIVLVYIGQIYLDSLDFGHGLYIFQYHPSMLYSDMNGFGHRLVPYLWFTGYWLVFSLLLAVLANLFWIRGQVEGIRNRLILARRKIDTRFLFSLGTFILLLAFLGGYIFYNTNLLHKYISHTKQEGQQVSYEVKYKEYAFFPQLVVTGAFVEVDLFPEKREISVRAKLKLRNPTKKPIKKILMNMPDILLLKSASDNFSIPFHVDKDDHDLYVKIVSFPQPVLPGETITLDTSRYFAPKGFTHDGGSNRVLENGTFFTNQEILPVFGYNNHNELENEKKRKKYDLPVRQRMPSINEAKEREFTYITKDGNWIDFETIVSTPADQIAIAPGYLQREWLENDRRYFHYKMDSKILDFYFYASARYVSRKSSHNGVDIEVFYHPTHEYNIDRMIDSAKKSLDYFSKNYSPYQFRQLRIIEFPRFNQYAQSFPNNIPYSESIGFIAKVDKSNPGDLDYPFYVTAHEVAHQWWAHQVIGGNVQGATFLSESLAQYSGFKIMEREYGREKIKKFFKYEMNSYLHGRSKEKIEELPLYLNENQQYIHYNKGGINLYNFEDQIGEAAMTKALSRFVEDFAFKGPPFPISLDLLRYLEEVTPPEKLHLIDDLFKSITLYDNRMLSAKTKKSDDKSYETTIEISSEKIKADGLGKEKNVPISDSFDIVLFDEKDNQIYTKKHLIKEKKTSLKISTKEKPEKAGIDPGYKYIDRNLEDNLKKIE